MLLAFAGLAIAFAALLTLRTWLTPTPLQEAKPSLPRLLFNAGISLAVLLTIFAGSRWAAITTAAAMGLYAASQFGRFFLPYAKGRSTLAQAGIFSLLTVQAAGFVYAFVAIALTLPRQGAT